MFQHIFESSDKLILDVLNELPSNPLNSAFVLVFLHFIVRKIMGDFHGYRLSGWCAG